MFKFDLINIFELFGCLLLLHQIYTGESLTIDPDHQAFVPECGQSSPMSRISNSKKSEYHYPWVISVYHFKESRPPSTEKYQSHCSGSIISET